MYGLPAMTPFDWTPTISFGGLSVGITYGIQSGRIRRIGDWEIWDCQIVLTSKGSSVGNMQINGFLHNTPNVAFIPHAAYPQFYSALAGITSLIARVIAGGGAVPIVRLYNQGATDVTQLTDANFNNNSQILVGGWHYAA